MTQSSGCSSALQNNGCPGNHSLGSSDSSSARFSYPSTQAYVVRLRRERAPRRRGCDFCARRCILGSFAIFLFAVLLLGSLWLLLSFHATENVEMRRNYSRVFAANSLFVRRIVVTNRLQNEGPVIYGLSVTPELNKEINWTEEHDAFVPSNDHQEWAFWLNRGSQVEVQYNISNPSMELLLAVIQGEENMQKWIKNPTTPDPVSSWKVAQGNGTLQYKTELNHNYYFSFANVQSSDAQVNVQLKFQSKVYSTENCKSQCYLTSATCAVHLNFLASDVLLLTSPQTDQGIEQGHIHGNARFLQQGNGVWNVNIAFEQRWVTYLVFWGAMAMVLLILLIFCKPARQDMETSSDSQTPVAEATLVDAQHEDDEKLIKIEDFDEEETEGLEDYMCIICFAARRSCFFDPCGHSATCYSCSMKISKQKKSLCPLCRQPIRFIRRLFLH